MDDSKDKIVLDEAAVTELNTFVPESKVNPMNRGPKEIKIQVRDFLYKIQKKLKTGGLNCKLSPNIQSQQGRSLTIISFRFSHETESAPMAFIETNKIFNDPELAEGEIVKQIHDTLKTLARMARDKEPKEVIL